MGLETATYIEDLVPSNPVGPVDTLGQADDHLRLIKSVLQSQFPNLGQEAVTRTAAQLNAGGFRGVQGFEQSYSNATTLAIAEGLAVSDDADPAQRVQIDLAGLSKTTGAFVAGDGLGARLDAALWAADTAIAVWALYNPTTEASDIGFSAEFGSGVVPLLPAGYTKKRLVGSWMFKPAPGLVNGQQAGKRYDFFESFQVVSAATWTGGTEPAAVSVDLLVPPLSVAIGNLYATKPTTGRLFQGYVRPPTASIKPWAGVSSSDSALLAFNFTVAADSTGKAEYAVHSETPDATADMHVNGWVMP